jgi:Protein of unknown function (DUF2510)
MQEYTTVSSSSYDPSALAVKLNDMSAEGWSVVSIVSTGGDITAFLSRESTGMAASARASADPVDTSSSHSPDPMASYQPMVPEHAAAPAVEPAGWAVAPEAVSPQTVSPIAEPAPVATYTPAATTYAPAAAAAPAAAVPAVPAGWYADPAGRFELRYWDGGTWTEHVSRAGQQFTDPPVA